MATGKCRTAATDGGTDGGLVGVDAGVCAPGSCTTGGQLCNPATGTCTAPLACVATNLQPDTCSYGLICNGFTCAEAPRNGVTCANFANVVTPRLWNPVGLNPAGPVTVSVTNRADDVVFCGSPSVAVSGTDVMYAAPLAQGGTNFPSAGVLLPADLVNFVRPDGQVCDVQRGCANGGQFFRPSGYQVSNGNKNLTLNFTLCWSTSMLTAGFYAERGNAVCADLN
jgi:hypothetical protein